MIAPAISDHALLRWMERAHGIDVQAWRNLMRAEVNASLQTAGLQRAGFGPAFVIAADGSTVVTYLPEGMQVSPYGNGIAIPRTDTSASEAA